MIEPTAFLVTTRSAPAHSFAVADAEPSVAWPAFTVAVLVSLVQVPALEVIVRE